MKEDKQENGNQVKKKRSLDKQKNDKHSLVFTFLLAETRHSQC